MKAVENIVEHESCVQKKQTSGLVSKNVTIFERRTSVRLEPEMWRALSEVAEREQCTVHAICSLISHRKSDESSLTAAIRVFVMLYFKAAATDEGHLRSGHGNFVHMLQRAQLPPNVAKFFSKMLRKSKAKIAKKWKMGNGATSNLY